MSMRRLVIIEDETDIVKLLEYNCRRELVARVKAVLRRQERGFERREVVEAGHLRVDSRTREVWVRDRPIELSTLEFKLLHFLASNPRHVFSREELLDEVWGRDRFVTPRNVDVHVRRLREKIEAFPEKPQYLQTVRGSGYRFALETARQSRGSRAVQYHPSLRMAER